MLDLGKIESVKSLLAQGNLSRRQISRLTGVSRAIIAQIAAGVRPDYAARQRERDALERPAGPIARCRTCGGRVYMPCVLCQVRAYLARHPEACRARRPPVRDGSAGQPLAARPPLRRSKRRKVG